MEWVKGPGEDTDVVRDRDRDGAEIGQGSRRHAATRGTGISSVERVVDHGIRGGNRLATDSIWRGERDGETAGNQAIGAQSATIGEDDSIQEVRVHEIQACCHPVFLPLNFGFIGAAAAAVGSTRNLAVLCELTGICLGEFCGETVDDGKHVGVRVGHGTDLLIPVDVALHEIWIGKQAVPPRIVEKVRAAAGTPDAWSGVTSVRRTEASVTVPDRPHLDGLVAILVEEAAQSQRIHVESGHTDDHVVNPGIDIDVLHIAGRAVEARAGQVRDEVAEVATDVLFLRITLRQQDVQSLGGLVDYPLPGHHTHSRGVERTLVAVHTIHTEQVSARDRGSIGILGLERFDVHPALGAFGSLLDHVDPVVMVGANGAAGG